MIARANVVDPIALETAARIAEQARPWRIVLFGSRARGTANPDADYDFYIEVDAVDDALREIERRIRACLPIADASFDLKVVKRGTLERRRNDPGAIEWDIAREGKLLFADPEAPASIAPETRVRERPPTAPESAAEWLESAERDERHAELLRRSEGGYWPEICWLSHQACEKRMKAVVISHFVRPKRTHDLTRLLGALRQNGIDAGAIDDDCASLTTQAIIPRYPAGLALTEEDARAAAEAARRIADALR